MVQWINTFPDASGPPGAVGGFARLVVTTLAGRPTTGRVYNAYLLASPGTVDVNLPTRGQYIVPAYGPVYTAQVGFRFDAADAAAAGGRTMTAVAFRAPASAFGPGVVPTPAQIRGASIENVMAVGNLGSPNGRTTAGDLHTLNFLGGLVAEGLVAQPPNTKFWYMIAPMYVANMAGYNPATDSPVGDINVNGRALSMWTNRTPLAPVITTPSGQITTFAGTTVDLTFVPKDPDRIASFTGDSGARPDFEDVAGVQIQYAPRPTEETPNPTWTDLPIGRANGTANAPGWYIDDAVGSNTGAKGLWLDMRLAIRCGTTNPVEANKGYLPSGDWQVRIRTFDYGHAYPFNDLTPDKQIPPLVDSLGAYTPDNYPAVNTSPWSEPVFISVSAQVPKPLAISPTNNRAFVEDTAVALVWQYRNTYDPPYPQALRTVQIRRTGEAQWTTLTLNQASSGSSFAIGAGSWSGYGLVSGNQYEWRVQVTDSSGVVSDWSDPAYFWVVPAPGTGEVIPTPGDTINGATLGCGTHRVEIFRRGGTERVGEIRNISSVRWNRVRDDISTAKIVVSGWDIDCGNLLAKLESWAYEVVIFRDNGYGVDRVWEGPITLLTYEQDSVVIHAKDVMAYAFRRIIKQAVNDSGSSSTAGRTVVARATAILQNAFAPDDPNLLSHLRPIVTADDAKQYRSTPEYSRTAFEEVDDMAANAGLDYTALGRAILVWSTKHRIGTLPEFRDEDLGASPIVSEYGMSMANRYAVSDGNGVYGEADRLNEFGKDPKYGLVEMLSSTWASDSAEQAGTYTQAGLETVRRSFEDAAERSIADRYGPPVVVRIPDNTRLNPDTVLSIQHLVPGVVVPLRSTGTLRSVVATQKLDSVSITEENGTETITVVLSPFSRDDNNAGEESAE